MEAAVGFAIDVISDTTTTCALSLNLEQVMLQEYWPAVMDFVEQHSLSEAASDGQDAGEGVAEAVQASQAGVKPPSAVGPLGLASHGDEAQQGAAGFKKEL